MKSFYKLINHFCIALDLKFISIYLEHPLLDYLRFSSIKGRGLYGFLGVKGQPGPNWFDLANIGANQIESTFFKNNALNIHQMEHIRVNKPYFRIVFFAYYHKYVLTFLL